MDGSKKYPRTYHYPFSPGTTSDDRINHNYWEDITKIKKVIHTEKLDGENTCLNRYGVFARSHAAPTTHPWANYLKVKWNIIKNDLADSDIEIFGENLYAIHSIEYLKLENHFFIFGVREKDCWLPWDEVKFYANFFDFKTVPTIDIVDMEGYSEESYKDDILDIIKNSSHFGSKDTYLDQPTTMEGIVTRNFNSFNSENFKQNVFKYVRKGHVKTGKHWRHNWQRAKLIWEKGKNGLETT